MKLLMAILFTTILTLTSSAQSLEGLAGADLASAVREIYCPKVDPTTVSPSIATWFDAGKTEVGLTPSTWWGADAPLDYYNIVNGSQAFIEKRSDYPPGVLTEVTSSGEGWLVGTGVVADQKTNFWSPADDRRGDLARRMMYMATIYPSELWCGRAVMIFCDGSWPLLQGYGKQLLLEWHRIDPVDERELAECQIVKDLQGNENPFVTMPDLAEYLWGEHAGEVYISTENRDRQPLKAVYSIATDEFIDLYSPYIAIGSQWKIDGQSVDAESVELSKLGVGIHEISFNNSEASGSLKITVKP